MKRFWNLLPDRHDIGLIVACAAVLVLLFVVLTRNSRSEEPRPVDLFSVPDVPAPANAPSEPLVDLFALADQPAVAEVDKRPVIDAYSVKGCLPCAQEEKDVGSGTPDYRVRWHHSDTGEDHPWHIHNFALRHGYPVHHYQDAGGHWKRSSGLATAEQLAAMVGKKK